MVDSLSRLQEASFDGMEFPVETVEVNGGNDLAEFSAFRRPGVDVQPTGRKAWRGTLVIPCINTASLVARYGVLFPNLAYYLVDRFTSRPIATLTLPTFGNLTAAVGGITHTASADDRGGVRLRVEFVEHNATAALLFADTASGVPTDASASTPLLATAADAAGSTVTGYVPTASTVSAQQTYLDAAPRTASQTDGAFRKMLAPVEANLALPAMATLASRDAFVATLNLRAAVIAYRNAVVPSAQTRSRYTVPRTMAVWEIALAVYGDASQVQAILSANTFTDATAIRAGTVVSVLPID